MAYTFVVSCPHRKQACADLDEVKRFVALWLDEQLPYAGGSWSQLEVVIDAVENFSGSDCDQDRPRLLEVK